MLASQNKTNRSISVLKFGGTSVKDVGRIQHVADIVQQRLNEGPVLVVVSAMGDTTDWLVRLAKSCASDPDCRELDQLLATGEQVSISLLAMVLCSRGFRARSLTGVQAGILTDCVHNNARVVEIGSRNLLQFFEDHDVIIVAGFQGVADNGDTTTLGRGGSDTSAVALAAACGASACDIYTDVDGILSADPNVIAEARLLSEISAEDAAELSRLGAQVIHPRAVELARHYRVPLRVRNTFNPGNPGTQIKGEEKVENYKAVTGIAIDRDNSIVCIEQLSGRPEVVSQILELVSSYGITADLINQNLQTAGSISFTVSQNDLARTIKVLDAIVTDGPKGNVSFDPDAAKVSLVGAGIAGSVGIAARVFGVLGRAGINIKLASTSDRRLTVVVSAQHADQAARLLHKAFDLGKETIALQKTS